MRLWSLVKLFAGGGMLVVLGAAALMLWPLLWPPDPDASVQLVNGRLMGEATGYVGHIDRDARTVDVSASLVGWRPVVLTVNEATAILVQNRQGGFGDLWKDMPVRVSYEVVGDHRLAKSIEVVTGDGEPSRAVNGAVSTSPNTSVPAASIVPTPAAVQSAPSAAAPPTSAIAPPTAAAPPAPAAQPPAAVAPPSAPATPPPAARVAEPAPVRTPAAAPAVTPSRAPEPPPVKLPPAKLPPAAAPSPPSPPPARAALPASPEKAPASEKAPAAEKPAAAPEKPAPVAEPSRRVEPAPAARASQPAAEAPSAARRSNPGDADAGDGAAAIDWLLKERGGR